MYKKIRLYGRIVNTWVAYDERRKRDVTTQYEIEYTDYNQSGEIVGKGTEDFSAERYRNLDFVWVWSWDGERRNKGGFKWWDCREQVLIDTSNTKNKDVKELYEAFYRNKNKSNIKTKEVQIRR